MKPLKSILNTIIKEETFNSLFKEKGKWVELSTDEKKELSNNLWNLVSNAYDTRFKGGHPRLSSPQDVANDSDMSFWKAADIDNDPHADVVVFGRRTSNGVKIYGIGHKNTSLTKR